MLICFHLHLEALALQGHLDQFLILEITWGQARSLVRNCLLQVYSVTVWALQATNILQALATHCHPHSATKLSTSCQIGKCRRKKGRVQSKHSAQLPLPDPTYFTWFPCCRRVCSHNWSAVNARVCVFVCVYVMQRNTGVEGLVINIAHNFILIFLFFYLFFFNTSVLLTLYIVLTFHFI